MRRRYLLAAFVGLLCLATGVLVVKLTSFVRRAAPAAEKRNIQAGAYRITGPYAYENLTVFLIHGADKLTGKAPLTLEEALAHGQVVVHETSEVNELAVENVSSNEEVFVQAGDIVKGGRQDRMLAVDLIVPPRSGKLPIDAFCVEHGRWYQRGHETANAFSMSSDMAATKDLKLAAKRSRSQSEVWARAAEAQEKLSTSLRTEVRNADSASSLQLSLENPKVQETAKNYTDALAKIIAGQEDVLGYAFTVNGQINSADVYASSALFRKLWPKLLKASAIEAAAELATEQQSAPVLVEQVRAFLTAAEQTPQLSEQQVTERITLSTRESDRSVLLETRDAKQGGLWLHRNYLLK